MLKSCVLLGLDWVEPVMHFFCMSHAHAHFMHTYHFDSFFFFWYLLWWCFSICLPLSLSWIVCAWHLSANPLRLETLFISGHLLLIPLLFTFGSMMRWPIRTSQRNFPNVLFTQNATWFYQIFLILLYPLSYTVRDRNLYLRYPWVVQPWPYKSSTPICMVSIPLYLGLLHRFKVYVS